MIVPRGSVVRRLLIGILAGLAVLVAADTGLWLFATARLDDQLATWQARRRAAGWTISTGRPEWTGWPLTAAIGLPDLVLAGGADDLPGGLSWRVGYAELSVPLLRPRLLTIRAAGQQNLRLAFLPELAFAADRFEVAVPLVSGQSVSGQSGPRGPVLATDLTAAGLRAGQPGKQVEIATLAVHADTWPAAARGEALLSVTASAAAVALPPLRGRRPWPPGPHIDSAAFEVALSGPWAGAADIAARAAAWHDSGGTLELRHLAVGWGRLGMSGGASMALGRNLQPEGDATVHLVGYDDSLDSASASGVLPPPVALAVRGVLAILAGTTEDGASQVELPVRLHDRTLAIGPFPLVRLAEWRWR